MYVTYGAAPNYLTWNLCLEVCKSETGGLELEVVTETETI